MLAPEIRRRAGEQKEAKIDEYMTYSGDLPIDQQSIQWFILLAIFHGISKKDIVGP